MVDQLNSHAQIGVSVTVGKDDVDDASAAATGGDEVNRYAEEDQGVIMAQVGAAIGAELKKIVYSGGSSSNTTGVRSSRFCCPLDEALVECILTTANSSSQQQQGKLITFTLPPYGKYPSNKGRSKIGTMKTQYVETFFASLASTSGVNISLHKIRGDNGHHVVESAFKAFSRALRNLIDGTDTTSNYCSVGSCSCNSNAAAAAAFEEMWGVKSESYTSSLELCREGKLERSTKETLILVHVWFNGLAKGQEEECVVVDTGIKTMDEFVSILAKEACMSVEVKCKGDL